MEHANASAGFERERRYLVRAFDRSVLGNPSRFIQQGYFDVLGDRSFRVRVLDGMEAVLTLKKGSGESRWEDERPLGLDPADLMLQATPYAIEKRRRKIEGWDFDVFEGPLSGIVLAEYETHGDELAPALPPWITDAIDVTDSLTNLHLARLAREISGDAADAVRAYLAPRLPKIVLTGGPCSGKSALMAELARAHGSALHCVPEVATILIAQVGISPSTPGFQSVVYRVQRSFEEAAELQAIADGKRAVLLDRGTVDALAYMAGGEAEFLRLTGKTAASERSRYAKVLCLAAAPRDVFEREKRNNAARAEEFDQAVERGTLVTDAWAPGGNADVIDGDTWPEKLACAVRAIESLLAA